MVFVHLARTIQRATLHGTEARHIQVGVLDLLSSFLKVAFLPLVVLDPALLVDRILLASED